MDDEKCVMDPFKDPEIRRAARAFVRDSGSPMLRPSPQRSHREHDIIVLADDLGELARYRLMRTPSGKRLRRIDGGNARRVPALLAR